MKDFDEIYKTYSSEIFKYLLFKTGNHHISEELLQETFYQGFKSIYRFKGNSKLSTWLYQIAKNVHLKYLRKNKKEFLAYDDSIFEIAYKSTPEDLLDKKENNILIAKALSKLKEPYREVIILRSFNELSFREIGEIFEKSENWSRVTFYRGKIMLKDIILKEGGDYHE